MAESSPGDLDPQPTLSYVSQREYRPTNAFQPKSALLGAIGGVLCAAIAAAVVVLWHMSPVPVIIGLSGLVQGIILGLLLRSAFRRAKIRSMPTAIMLCIFCGVFSGILTYAGLYVNRVYSMQSEIRKRIAGRENESGGTALLFNMSQRPFHFYDAFVLEPETKHGGLIGFFLSKKSVTLGGEPTPLFITFFINTAVLCWTAFKLGKSQVLRPFCEECGAWFKDPTNATVLPAEYYKQLAEVIQSGQPDAAIALTREAAGQELQGGCVIARSHKCPQCGGIFVDVIVKFAGSSDRPTMRPVRVTPEMLQALKSEPVVMVIEEDPPTASPPAN